MRAVQPHPPLFGSPVEVAVGYLSSKDAGVLCGALLGTMMGPATCLILHLSSLFYAVS